MGFIPKWAKISFKVETNFLYVNVCGPVGVWYKNGEEFWGGSGVDFIDIHRAELGQRGELGIIGSGTQSSLWEYWMVFDQDTVNIAPSGENLILDLHRCFPESTCGESGKGLDFLKKEKKATVHPAQKARCSGLFKDSCEKIAFRI